MSSNYILGATVKLPLQITENSIPLSEPIVPQIKKIIMPNGTSEPSFPQNMTILDSEYSVYVFEYKPKDIGDYIVIFSFEIDGVEYTSMEHFVVSLGYSAIVPKAVAR